ncbi:MAG: energy transducer TonB [Flavobacteriales bacterium]|nr:energy transducer TonB [Flavobacteriales bacterium]
MINEVASAPLRSAAPLQVEAPDKPPLNPGQTQTPRSKRTHNPWLIGSLSALLLGVGIYGLIELSKRHTLTEAERSQAGDWFSDLRSEQWVLVSSADPSATEYLLTLNPSPVTADSYGKTTIRLEVELRPTASGTNERYVAVEERPYTDLSEPSELYLTDGNEEIGAGTSIMLRRITSDSIIVEFRSEDGVGDVLGGVTEKRFAALREAAILHEANALVRTVDSLLQGGGLVRRGIFRSYACGEECVASFLILQNGQPVHAAYVCNNNRFGEIQLSQGNMIGVGDFTNQALVGSSFLIVTQRTMVENEEGESAPVDVITGLLPFTDEEVTPELQQRLAVAANVDMLAASRADGISVAGVAQQFIGDGEVRELKDVEEQPQFPGGADAMYSFLNRSVKYPEAELDAGVQGKVYVEFVVASDGSLRDAKVKRGVADGLDREALRVVRTMTRWTPGRVNGKPVSCRYILPITFALR